MGQDHGVRGKSGDRQQAWTVAKDQQVKHAPTTDLILRDEQRWLRASTQKLTREEREFVQGADFDELKARVEEYVDTGLAAQQRHELRKGPLRRAAFSGVVEVVKAVDQQYGGAAYGALSVLLIVGVNKNRKESRIEAALQNLQKEFLRVRDLQEIHPEPNMLLYIKEASVLGIRFFKFAIRYYLRSSWRRVVEAITKPPNIELDEIESEIARAIAEIQKERAHLDTKRLKDVQDHVDDLRARSIENDLASFRSLLGVERKDRAAILDAYDEELDAAFKNLPRWNPFDFKKLKKQQSYQDWAGDKSSSLLLLYGKTRAHSGSCCWLSRAANAVIETVGSTYGGMGLFFCQPERSITEEVPAPFVLRDIAYQLIDQEGEQLCKPSYYDSISKKVTQAAAKPSDLDTHFALLQQAVASLPSVLIMIDRIDRIRGDTLRWLEGLMRILKGARTRVHVLLIASSNGEDEPGGKLEPLVFARLEERLGHSFRALEDNNP